MEFLQAIAFVIILIGIPTGVFVGLIEHINYTFGSKAKKRRVADRFKFVYLPIFAFSVVSIKISAMYAGE